MFRIQIGDATTFPEEISTAISFLFSSNKENGKLPKVYSIDKDTGDPHLIGFITNFGITENGFPAIEFNLDIDMKLDEETGEILAVVLKEQEPSRGEV